ncbi:unnamed protein product [Rotaria sordida]|uniref:Transposase n=2 Tax=Rotaria sordida TaxID=392033 RepID=A0A819JEF9_9BILA|nr:unnamed protein product [Rotaria sordida]
MRTALNIQAPVIYEELYTVHGDQAPCLRTVERWCKRFREGQEELEDEARPGRPISETTPENIEQVRLIIEDDLCVTIEEAQEQTGLSYGTTQRIITDHLQLTKITARYLPKQLTDFQRNERVRICQQNLAKFRNGTWRLCNVVTGDESWFYHKQIGRKSSNAAWVAKGDPPPTIIRRNKFDPKTLFSIFFKSTGPLLIHHVEWGQTIDHQYYIDNCLEPLLNEIRHQRPSYGTNHIILHQDNGRPHLHKNVSDYLESEGITTIPHPPNSPDLSPCDFWLFDLIKRNLSDHNDAQSLHDAITEFMYSLNKEEYKKTFDKWIERMQLCVDNQGHYFEHLMK